LNFAIDRKALVKFLRNNIGDAGVHGFVPPVLNNEGTTGFEFNPEMAKDEMKKAGFIPKNAQPLVLTTTSDYLDMAVLVKKYWENIGFKINIDVQTGGMLRQLRNKGNLSMFRGSWIADYTDAENYLACFYSGNFSPGGPNYTHFKSLEFDRIYENILESIPGKQRDILVAKADSVLMADAPIVVLYYDQSIRLYHHNVIDLTNDAANRLILKRVRKTASE
jgi:peptide/nickel transport system substrate-binding protein